MTRLNSFKKKLKAFRWKVIKFLFKNQLESERLMILANLMEKKDSYYRYMPNEKEESVYDVDKEAFFDEELYHYYEHLKYLESIKNKNTKVY